MSSRKEDRQIQAAVLSLLLEATPHQMTDAEVLDAVTAGSRDFGTRDDAQRAIRDLIAVGLLHRIGSEFLWPTHAARRASDLLDD